MLSGSGPNVSWRLSAISRLALMFLWPIVSIVAVTNDVFACECFSAAYRFTKINNNMYVITNKCTIIKFCEKLT